MKVSTAAVSSSFAQPLYGWLSVVENVEFPLRVTGVAADSVPIWVANFVLAEYGTGAIMAVPAHDQRDYEFARKYDLPIRIVVRGADTPATVADMTEAAVAYGSLVDSGPYSGDAAPEIGRAHV